MAAQTAVTAQTATLSANTVDSILLSGPRSWIQVVNHTASTSIYVTRGVTVAGTVDPTVAGDDCFVCLPGIPLNLNLRSASTVCLKLISAGTPTYTVQAVDLP